MASNPYSRLRENLSVFLPPDRLVIDPLRTLAYGTDASFYRLIPKLVVMVESEEEVSRLLAAVRELKTPVTFRAAGTSLSGQAVTDSVLVMLGRGWTSYTISDDGGLIRLQPGVVGGHANASLARFGRKIGPDPASINSAMIGGIAANNASGMCCGTAQNSYKTLAGMRVILADGFVLDTLDPRSRETFLRARSGMASAIVDLAERVRANAPLADRIRSKFRMKNTTGYSLNALVDFTEPVDILQHLMIGSEGTLGFIAQIAYHTVPEYGHKASALMMFPGIGSACAAVTLLTACPVNAVELMDRASLRSVETKAGMPEYLKDLRPDVSALLVETQGDSPDALRANIREITAAVASLPQVMPAEFTDDPAEYALLWNIRKGLFPSVGAMRRTGTTCIIEDVAFPVARLAEATLDLQLLFLKHGYREAIIFGHAREGNLHFVFNQNFNISSEVARYARFIDDLTAMVVKKYDGSLKAEHGTGRNMAPFVELEWGAEAYGLMKEIKRIFDPEGLLNPGVVLNDDRTVHVKNLKPLPTADPIVDKCIECGFCEVHCPSLRLTISPRQRITVYREMARLAETRSDPHRLNALREAFVYEGDETCATDGLCSLACPVGIDTGKLIKSLRHSAHTPTAHAVATFVAGHMAGTTSALRMLLRGADIMRRLTGEHVMSRISGMARTITRDTLPLWNRNLPRHAKRVRVPPPRNGSRGPTVVYFPTCINRTFGASVDYGDDPAVTQTTIALLDKAGYHVSIPTEVDSLCCGMAFDSKGFKEQGREKAQELGRALLDASESGRHPVYVDLDPCVWNMKGALDGRLRIFDAVEFSLNFLVDRLEFHKRDETVAIHTTCSGTKMGHGAGLERLASLCASRVIVPDGVGCCGWAGDRGFTVPELTGSALHNLKNSITTDCTGGYSTSRTCEIGLSLHSGISYKSIMHLINRCTTGKETT